MKWSTGGLAVVFLGCILVAGLWPFGLPRNDVSWLPNQGGVRLGIRGTMLSDGPLTSPKDAACTIEFWLRPRLSKDSSTLLAFYGPNGSTGISIHQSHADLRVDREANGGAPARMYLDDTFRAGDRVFFAVVAAPTGTAIYWNGRLVRQSGNLRMISPCSGMFVVGDSPRTHNTWRGDLRGLAIYQHARTAEQVMTDSGSLGNSWKNTGSNPEARAADVPDVFYRFNEGNGRSIRDSGTSGVNLYIPERYRIVHEKFLESPRLAFEPTRDYVLDILINICGFAPLGFALTGYLLASGRIRRVSLAVVILGFFISLAVESLQTYLPTRDSDLTDVITNTLGTSVGVLTYWIFRRWVG